MNNIFLHQSCRIRLKALDRAVGVECPEDDASEGDIGEPPLPPRCHPSPPETSAALNVLANFTVFEDADGTMWPHMAKMSKFVFAKRPLEVQY